MKSAVGWSPETQLKATADPRPGFQAYKDIAFYYSFIFSFESVVLD